MGATTRKGARLWDEESLGFEVSSIGVTPVSAVLQVYGSLGCLFLIPLASSATTSLLCRENVDSVNNIHILLYMAYIN